MLADGLVTMYGIDRDAENPDGRFDEPQLDKVFEELAGASFGGGLYRVHMPSLANAWTDRIEEYFPELRDRLICFGYDWMGRQFCMDRERRDGRNFQVLLLDASTGEALEIPATMASLHIDELVQNGDRALALDYYADWREESGDDDFLPPDECVGYSVPLFLGGEDDVANLSRVNMEAYWAVLTQLRQGALELEPGTTIHDLELDW